LLTTESSYNHNRVLNQAFPKIFQNSFFPALFLPLNGRYEDFCLRGAFSISFSRHPIHFMANELCVLGELVPFVKTLTVNFE